MSYNYRIQYKKEKSLKFISHLDLISLFSRTLRRTQMAVTLTQGYNPRLKFSFSPALSLGISGWQEYLDLCLEDDLDPKQVKEKINQVSPSGLAITRVKKIQRKDESLSKLIRWAVYLILFGLDESQNGNHEVQTRNWEKWFDLQIKFFLDRPIINAEKKTKKGLRQVDLKPYIQKMEYNSIKNDEVMIRLILDIQTMGSINPQIIVNTFLGQLREKSIWVKEIIREKLIIEPKEKN